MSYFGPATSCQSILPLVSQPTLPPLCRSILPLVGQSYLTLFLALAMVGTRATCVRVAKVERLPQS